MSNKPLCTPINIGFNNMLMSDKIVAIVSPDGAPIKRMVQEGREKGIIVDATAGRRTRSVIFTNSQYIVLSALMPDTLSQRL
ncbi:MAG: DUF370 domain-containing protein [Defluviitaleaceae bacterium]|nr:DUF370 domain-containing protein [Defluviitaleaceae bacterium]